VSQRPAWSDEPLADLAALPLDHPDVQAVRGDPERWARLIALREFLQPAEAPAGARTGEAVAHLRGAVRDALDRETEGAKGPVRAVRAERRGLPSWLGGWRPALAAAAAVIVVGALLLPRLTERSGTLRGTREAMVETLPPVTTGEYVQLSWRAVERADLYEVHLLRADLGPAAPVISTADTTATVPRGQVFPSEGAEVTVFWRVVALRAGLRVAESGMEPLEPGE